MDKRKLRSIEKKLHISKENESHLCILQVGDNCFSWFGDPKRRKYKSYEDLMADVDLDKVKEISRITIPAFKSHEGKNY